MKTTTQPAPWPQAAAIDPPLLKRPVALVPVRLGFPSPTEDFEEDALDLNQLMVRNAPATFFYRAAGDSMTGMGIHDGDILVVDRSLRPRDGDLVVATWGGNAAVCKQLRVRPGRVELHSAAAGIEPIVLAGEEVLEAFVVTGIVRQVERGAGRDVRAG